MHDSDSQPLQLGIGGTCLAEVATVSLEFSAVTRLSGASCTTGINRISAKHGLLSVKPLSAMSDEWRRYGSDPSAAVCYEVAADLNDASIHASAVTELDVIYFSS